MTCFTVLLLPLVLLLGFWQLERATEKRALEESYFDRLGALPRAPTEKSATAAFTRIRLDGHYEVGRDFLIDNQVHEGRAGYQVVSSFLGTNGGRWLVNRGWVAGPERRDALPEIPTPREAVRLVGVIWPELGLPPLLAEDPWPEGWPKRVQRLDTARMAAVLPGSIGVEVRLEAGYPGVFVAARQEFVVSPAKHTGYAVQWFGLAAALVIGYALFGFRKDG